MPKTLFINATFMDSKVVKFQFKKLLIIKLLYVKKNFFIKKI